MTTNKQSLQQTIQLIVDILSHDTSHEELEYQLKNTSVDWEAMVKVASAHLVLPAVYCRLQQRGLIHELPEDLIDYLTELTQLNRERNATLLKEAQEISKLFNSHNINHVFVKGIGLLAGNYFKDTGERMIGDIDILIADEDLENAFQLLITEGYDELLTFNYDVKNYRHKPRQISTKCLGAVELHQHLLKHNYNHLLDTTKLLADKTYCNGIAIPNKKLLIWNTILGQQINDNGYFFNTINLKAIYDVLAVGVSQNPQLMLTLSQEKYSSAFLHLASVYHENLTPSKRNFRGYLKKKSLVFNTKHQKFGQFSIQLKSLLLAVKERIVLLMTNKSYRHHIFNNKMK